MLGEKWNFTWKTNQIGEIKIEQKVAFLSRWFLDRLLKKKKKKKGERKS